MILLALMLAVSNGYTNHAGNVIAGWPVKLTATHVMLGHGAPGGRALPTTPDGTLPTTPDGT